VAPETCSTGIYSFSSAKAVSNNASPMPTAPNSLLFDLAGDKVFMGSDFGAQVINPTNLGTQSGAFTPLNTVTGRVLAVSNSGNFGVFSDTVHNPNQVYIANVTNATAASAVALNISGASAAAFSPDGLKTFIFGFDTNNNPNLYVYSTLQALQVIPLPAQTSVNAITFSTNGAFAYVVEPSEGGAGPAVTVYNTCDNQLFTDTLTGRHDIPLTAPPVAFRAMPDGVHFIALESDGTLESFTASITGIPPATLSQAATALCPMTVGHSLPTQRIDLGQGAIQPINFFVSADGTLIYVVARDRGSILVYNANTGGVSGIPLIGTGNPTPISADISVDGSTILVAATDGLMHQIDTTFGGADVAQVPFPNLANFQNPFCTFTPASGACILDVVAARP
jgi:WD40 repeat protein